MTQPLFDTHPNHPPGTVVLVPAATGTYLGIKSDDGRWRRLEPANNVGTSDEHVLPHARVLHMPGGEA